jgi:hypothetical protein
MQAKAFTGEQRLLAAILFDAIASIQKGKARGFQGRPKEIARGIAALADDRAWFASDEYAPWSFCWVCSHLDLDPDAVRKEVSSGNAAGRKHYGNSSGATQVLPQPSRRGRSGTRRGPTSFRLMYAMGAA